MTARPWTARGAPGIGGRGRRTAKPAAAANAVRARMEGRLDWQDLADRARAACLLGDAAADPDTVLHLQRLVARTGRADPPFESATDRGVAAGFRLLVQAWTDRPPERRAALAEAILAAARLVDGQIHDERLRLTAGWKRQFGGD